MTNLPNIVYQHINDRKNLLNVVMEPLFKKHEWVLYHKKEKNDDLDEDQDNILFLRILRQFELVELKLEGSGGYVIAELYDDLAAKSKLVPNIDKYFLAPVGKLAEKDMHKHFCKNCNSEFDGSPKYQIEETPNEEIADGLVLVERGQYICHQCSAIIGEYREFEKKV